MIAEPIAKKTNTQPILEKYRSVRNYSAQLCQPLHTEDYIPQPVPYISPPKWHLAHTTWFFEEFVLRKYALGYRVFDEDFSYLFNSYYNAVGKRILRADRGNITRPGVEEVYEYRSYVDQMMEDFLANDLPKETVDTIVLGLHHEQQHQELLLTDLKYILGHNPTFPVYRNDFSLVEKYNDPSEKGTVAMPEGIYEIGFSGDGFNYDNELGRHKVFLPEYEMEKQLVTNGEYLAFINDGGYQRFAWWLDEGWSWVTENKINAPLYWHKIEGEWFYYTFNGLKKIDPQAILCHVNFFEAAAFAEWKNKRLPTEFEWEAAASHFAWGHRWEWTNSAYLPYPGFAKAGGAIGEYNGKFMVNQMVLRGASAATSPGHSRITYRNFFHTHLQWQCTGIRLATNQ